MKKAHFLLNTNSEDRGNYALVAFDRPLIASLKKYKKGITALAESCDHLLAATFEQHNFVCLFVEEVQANRLFGSPVFEKMMHRALPLRLSSRRPVTQDPAYHGTVLSRVLIEPNGFYWSGPMQGDHGIVDWQTELIPWDFLTLCLHCEQPPEQHAAGHCLFGSTKYEPLNDLKD